MEPRKRTHLVKEAQQQGCCASLSRAPLSARHEEKSTGTVLHEAKPVRTRACHAMMSSRAPSKACLIATLLLRFLEHFTNGHTRGRCGVCGQLCTLMPGRDTPSVMASGLPPHGET